MATPHGAIVVAVDTSPDSLRGLDWAAAAAAARKAPLHVLHALTLPATDLPPLASDRLAVRDVAEQLLAEAVGDATAAGADPVTSEIVERPPAAAILEAAKEASVVVVGARGHGATFGLLLGSVSQHVARHAECPVVVVREQASPRQRRIVVGVDGSPGSEPALAFGFETAALNKAPLVAVYGWPDHSPSMIGVGVAAESRTVERIAAGERLLAEALAGWEARYPAVEVIREAVPVHPARVLADASEHAALIVVGARGRGAFAGLLLGSISQSVLNHARCPVAVVR